MLPKTSLQSLTLDDVQHLNDVVVHLHHRFHDLRQAHIRLACLIADPSKAFHISETMVEDIAELYARLIDLERDYIKYIKKVRTINKIAK